MKTIRIAQIMGRMMGGGVEATIMNHYRYLDHSKIQFDFLVQEDSAKVPTKIIENAGGRVFTIPSYKNLLHYNQVCERIFTTEKPDIVHSNMNALSVFPLRAAAHAKIPVRIAHSHSTSNPQEFTKTAVKNILRPFSRIYPTHLAACGTLTATWLFGQRAVDKGDVHYIYNAIDLDKYIFNSIKRSELRSSIGISNDSFVVGQIGRFSAQKNQTFSIEIFNELLRIIPNAELVFLGIGDTLDTVKDQVVKLGIQDHVHFMGLRNDAASWYSVFDTLLFPSLYEGLPLTAIEAQAAGLSIVASDRITEEAFINKHLVNVVDLNSSAYVWASTLAKQFSQLGNNTRANQTNILKAAGYDIRESAKRLEQWYENIAVR